MLIPRRISPILIESIGEFPATFLSGARQCGKSTLARQLADKLPGNASYYTFDDARILEFASTDPQGFVESLHLPAIIDEVQLVENIGRAIKLVIDRRRRPGMFVLTGSAHLMVIPKLADALVGRLSVLTLYPFSESELAKREEDFIEFVFDHQFKIKGENGKTAANSRLLKEEIAQRLLRGGFPVAAMEPDGKVRQKWFASYLTEIVRREVRQLSDIEHLNKLPTLMSYLAASPGALLNVSNIAGHTGMPASTLSRYLVLLNAIYMISLLKPWSTRLTNILTKSQKMYFVDTGLASYLLGIDKDRLLKDNELFGRLLENFVYTEIVKNLSWSRLSCDLFHFRTRNGIEVDFILKDRSGRLLALEVKAAKSIGKDDFRGIDYFAKQFADAYTKGIVLYCGERILSFGNNRWAVPVSSLWSQKQFQD